MVYGKKSLIFEFCILFGILVVFMVFTIVELMRTNFTPVGFLYTVVIINVCMICPLLFYREWRKIKKQEKQNSP